MSARNAFKGGQRPQTRALAKQIGALMRAQREFMVDHAGGEA